MVRVKRTSRLLLSAIAVATVGVFISNSARAAIVVTGDLAKYSFNGTQYAFGPVGDPSGWNTLSGIAVGYNNSTPASANPGTLEVNGGSAPLMMGLEIGGAGYTVFVPDSPPIGYGAAGTVTVTGTGSWLACNSSSNCGLRVGKYYSGTLNITSRGTVSNAGPTTIGHAAGVTGIVDVGGTASTWKSGVFKNGSLGNAGVSVGYQGNGWVNIHGGGSVTNTVGNESMRIGDMPGSSGTVTVNGAGSKWTVTRSGTSGPSFTIGYNGTGTVEIIGGGSATTNLMPRVGAGQGGVGRVLVDGIGSRWDISPASGISPTMIGSNGVGMMTISNGGVVNNTQSVQVGNNGSSSGTVTVDGSGSTWTCSGPAYASSPAGLTIGFAGQGTVNLQNSGALVTDQIVGARDDFASNARMTLNFDGGILKARNAGNANWIRLGGDAYGAYNPTPGTAVINVKAGGAKINTNGFDMGIGNLSNSVSLQHDTTPGAPAMDGGLTKLGTGTLTLGGTNTYTGATTVEAGALLASTTAGLPGWNSTGKISVASGAAVGGRLDGGTVTTGWTAANVATLVNNTTWATSGGSLAIDTTNGDHVFGGVLADPDGSHSVGLLKVGANVLTLTGASAYTGATIVNAGALLAATTGALPGWNSPGNVIVNAGGAVGGRINGGTVTTGWTEANFDTLRSSTTWATSGGSLAIDTTNGDYSYAGVLADPDDSHAIGLVKLGVNTLTLNAANTYTGTTTVNAGVLAYGVSDAINTGAVLVNGGTLNLGSYSDSAGLVTLAGGAITGTTGTLTSTGSFEVQSGSVSAILGGTGIALTKTTSGTVVLSGANTFSGATTISAGTLRYANAAAIGATSGIAVGDAGTVAVSTEQPGGGAGWSATQLGTFLGGSTITFAGGALGVDTTNGDFTYAGNLAGAASDKGVTKLGGNTLTLTGASTYTGMTTVNAGTLAYGANDVISAGGVLVNGGTLAMGSYSDSVGVVTLASGAITGTTGTLTGANFQVQSGSVSAILGGAGISLTKTTSGTVTLSGANTYTGWTRIEDGVLAYGANNILSNSISVTVEYGGTLCAAGYSDTLASLVVGGTGEGTVTGGTLTSTTDFAVNRGSVSAVLAGSVGLVKDYESAVTLSGANTFTGPTTITNGILKYANAAALGATSGIAVGATGILAVSTELPGGGSGWSATQLDSIVSGGTITYAAHGSLGIDTTNGDFTYAGNLAGAASAKDVTKLGSNTLTLSGSNTYTGMTIINAGTLTISGSSLVTLPSQFFGYGTLNLNGVLNLDVTGVVDTFYNVVDVATLTVGYGAGFAVSMYGGPLFTETGNVWSCVAFGKKWAFDESTGQLALMNLISGDADGNGTVNSTDLGLLLSHYNQTFASDGWALGDFDANGTVNSTDLGLLLSHYNQTAATSAVPEPSTLLLTFAGLVSLLAYAWRKRK